MGKKRCATVQAVEAATFEFRHVPGAGTARAD